MNNFLNRAVATFSNKLDQISSKVVSTSSLSSSPASKSTSNNPYGSNKDGYNDGKLSTSFSTKLLILLAPFEEYFLSIQSILIWERPYVSAVFLIAINCLYWLIVSWTRRFLSIFSLLCLLTSIYQCWSNYVWPEIRARPPEPDEGWVPVHPTVLSAPELTYYLNELVTFSSEMMEWLRQLRKHQPGLFCILISVLFTLTAIIGSIVPGVVIVYIILMTLALGPGVVLYVVPESWYRTVRNFFGNSSSFYPSSTSSSPSPSNATITSSPLTSSTTKTVPAPSSTTPTKTTTEIHDIYDNLNVSSSLEKEQGRKLSEGFVKCDSLEGSFELDKDESSLQLLSDSKLDSTLDFELGHRPSRESSTPSSSSNSSLQLVPPMQFSETGDELEDYEIISDSDLPDDNTTYPGLSKVLFQKSSGSSRIIQQTSPSNTTTSSVSSTSTITPTKDMLESDL